MEEEKKESPGGNLGSTDSTAQPPINSTASVTHEKSSVNGDRPNHAPVSVAAPRKGMGRTLLRTLLRSSSRWQALQDEEENRAMTALERDPPPSSGEVEPFPLEVLPKSMQALVKEGANSIGCPVDYIGVPLLGFIGAAIGGTRVIEVKRGWRESAALFVAVVARPGDKKSPALQLAALPVMRRQEALVKTYLAAQATYKTKLTEYEIDVAKWKSRLVKLTATTGDKPEELQEPLLEQAFTTDSTIEALGSLLEQQPRGLLYLADELSGWARSFDQYRSGKGADRQHWLSFWNSAPVNINRKSQKVPIILPRPFVAVGGCLQPEVLGELSDERGREDGFVHRILFSYPDPLPGKWTDAELTDGAVKNLDALFGTLYTLQFDTNGKEQPTPKVISFSPAAKKLWIEWATAHYQEQTEESFPDNLRGPWAKLEAYTARFVLNLHCCRVAAQETQSEAADEEAMLGGWALCDYFKSHARRVYPHLRSTVEDRHAAAAQSWLERHNNQASARDFLRANVAGIKTSSEAQKLITNLIDRGWGKMDKSGKKDIFVLHPPDTRHLDENEDETST